jgi:uridylate kinase
MFTKKNNPTVLSLGGSIIIPKTGFDIPFLKAFRAMVLSHVSAGNELILVVGGGATCRVYQNAARQVVPLSDDDLDWIGIHTTVYNAQFVRMLLKDIACEQIVTDPRKKYRMKKPVLIAAGWKPGCSTDNDAVLLAKTYEAKQVINLSNIEYAFDKDPNVYADAKPLNRISWAAFRHGVVGDSWSPGNSAPFDPIASKTAEVLGLTVRIVLGTDIDRVARALRGEDVPGTTIHP